MFGLGRLARAIGVLLLFGPYLFVVRCLGAGLGIRWALLVARCHYLLSYLGAHRQTLENLQRIHPYLDSPLTPREILRRHLEVKHQSFVEWRLSPDPRGAAYLAKVYDVLPADEMDDLLADAESDEGMLLVGFHYGMYKSLPSALATAYQVPVSSASYVSAHYAASTFGPVARIAFLNAVHTAKSAPAQSLFLRPEGRPTALRRALKRGDFVAIAADGMISSDLVEAPFLGGKLRIPAGWAKLAALTGSRYRVAFTSATGADARIVSLTEPRQVGRDAEEIQSAVLGTITDLESHVRERPWDWHIWGRLKFEDNADGSWTIVPLSVTVQPQHYFLDDPTSTASTGA